MEDSELAVYVRQLTGKETNAESLAVLRGGAPALQQAEIEANAEAVKAKLMEVKDRVALYLTERWNELRKGKTPDETIVVVGEAFEDEDDDDEQTALPESSLAAPADTGTTVDPNKFAE